MRHRYLWDLAYLCHIDAPRVDALRCMDFFTYIQSIDLHYENERKRQEAGR